MRSHQSSVFQFLGGISAEVSGDAGEAESVLSDRLGGESVEFARVGNWRLMQGLPAGVLSRSCFEARAISEA